MIASLAALCVAYACNDHPTAPVLETLEPVALGAVVVAVVSGSTGSVLAGDEVAVGIRATVDDSSTIDVVQARIAWNREHLRWLGQVGDSAEAWPATRTIVNGARADDGELRLISANISGLEERFAELAFEVLDRAWPEGLSIDVEEAVDSDGVIRETVTGTTVAVDPSLTTPTSWYRKTYPRTVREGAAGDGGGPARVPGESSLYGDGNLDGAIDSLDYLYVAHMAVGHPDYPCIVGTASPPLDCLAVNVRPFNDPGLGGPSDPCPPGLETCGGFERLVTAADVHHIAHEAGGHDEPVVGEPIPGNVVADTTFLSGVITGTRTFAADSVYVLQSDVVVGDSATAGELVIKAGAEIRGMSGAALLVSRNGRIIADGTSQAPIRMVCHGATPSPGCWEGLVIAGSAPLNAGEAGLGSAPDISGRNDGGGGDQRTIAGVPYGGANAADSSGVLRHVVVEDAGEAGRGIALAGVGSGTVIDGVQSNRSDAVGIEVLGGSVDLAHVLVTAPATSGLAFSMGYDGAAQYVAVQMDPDASDGTAVLVTNAPGEPTATPATAPELWNLTVVGGTAFYRKHTALGFEDAGGVVRNALLVQAAVGVEANASACSLFTSDDLDVDYMVMLGTTESVVSASCASGIVAALEAGEADGVGNSRMYQGDLEDPFDGELLDIRPSDPLETETVPATPSGALDPTGEYFGAAPAGSGTVPWYTGWNATWERTDGLASLPQATGLTMPADTVFAVGVDGDSVPRRQISIRLAESATPAQIEDLFETFGLQVVGFGERMYVVRWPDPGPDMGAFLARRDSVEAHPAVEFTSIMGGVARDFGRYPIDSNQRDIWDPTVFGSGRQPFKDIRMPQAWACETGEGTPVVSVAALENGFVPGHEDLPAVAWLPIGTGTSTSSQLEHGVGVAGIIAAVGDNSEGIAGMVWNADLTVATAKVTV